MLWAPRGERPLPGRAAFDERVFRQDLEPSVIPSRLQRYVLWEIIPVIGICAVALTAIFFLGLSASFTREGVSVVQIYYIIPYILMLSLPYALPAAFLLGSVLVFGRLSSRHEIDAMRANGINVNHIILPPLALALVVCGATFFMNQYFFPGPWSASRRCATSSSTTSPRWSGRRGPAGGWTLTTSTSAAWTRKTRPGRASR